LDQQVLELAAFLHMTASHLLARPVTHLPFLHRWGVRLDVHVFVIHDHPVAQQERFGVFDEMSILKTLQMIAPKGVTIGRTDTSLLEDPFYGYIYAHSLSSLTHSSYSPVHGRVAGEGEYFLDSQLVHAFLQDHLPTLRDVVTPRGGESDAVESVFLPVFLFDISFESVSMLDGRQQAVGYPDMVIALQAKGMEQRSHVMCDGQNIPFSPRNASAAIVSAVLQTAWGVSSAHSWCDAQHSQSHNRDDWMWWAQSISPVRISLLSPSTSWITRWPTWCMRRCGKCIS
jgi:hypothetical protein